MLDWTPEEVVDHLEALELSHYSELFAYHRLSGLDLLDLTHDDLISVGVALLSDRKAVLRQLRRLIA